MLARALERAEGPGALVIAGNAFDLLVPLGGDPRPGTRSS